MFSFVYGLDKVLVQVFEQSWGPTQTSFITMYGVIIERVMQYEITPIIERVMQYEITPITPDTYYTGNTLAEDLAMVGNTFITCVAYTLCKPDIRFSALCPSC